MTSSALSQENTTTQDDMNADMYMYHSDLNEDVEQADSGSVSPLIDVQAGNSIKSM